MRTESIYCPFCGKVIHAGDQKCVSCGGKIPNVQFSLKDLEVSKEAPKTNSKIFWIVGILVVVFLFLILYFLFV